MKKLYFIFIFYLLLVLSGYSQYKSGNYPPCFGDTNQRAIPIEYSILFMQSGINIGNYDWSNSTINCNINGAVSDHKRMRLNMYGASGLAAVGLPIAAYGASSMIIWDEGVGTFALGSLITAGAVYLVVQSVKSKKSMDQRFAIIGDYYRRNKL